MKCQCHPGMPLGSVFKSGADAPIQVERIKMVLKGSFRGMARMVYTVYKRTQIYKNN